MSKRNAAQELIKHVGPLTVAYGFVARGSSYDGDNHAWRFDSDDEYLATLPLLNWEYDAGYGGQELFGIVVFTDGSWLERGEYDGSEWWEHNSLPTRERVTEAAGQWHAATSPESPAPASPAPSEETE